VVVAGWRLLAVVVILIVGGVAWRASTSGVDAGVLTYQLTTRALVASDPGGGERWRYAFPAAEDAHLPFSRLRPASVLANGDGMIVGINRIGRSTPAMLNSQLLWLTNRGGLIRVFEFTRELTFGGRQYGPPWVFHDFAVHEESSGRRTALAARHEPWWPSFVTVLNDRFEATGTFVNAGWIYHVQWMSSSRLMISGFSNARQGGMVALLDANALDGQSPIGDDPTYRCAACGPGAPLRYFVLPRTEINMVTASPPNEARLFVSGDRVLVRTMEMERAEGQVPEVLYEFSPSLDLVRASFGDRYWDMHRALELAGKLSHARETCPDRNGPRSVDVWEPATGWRTIPIR
jgi:hypothetical protein